MSARAGRTLKRKCDSARLTRAMAKRPSILAELRKHVPDAVKFYWQTRSDQLQKQQKAGGWIRVCVRR